MNTLVYFVIIEEIGETPNGRLRGALREIIISNIDENDEKDRDDKNNNNIDLRNELYVIDSE